MQQKICSYFDENCIFSFIVIGKDALGPRLTFDDLVAVTIHLITIYSNPDKFWHYTFTQYFSMMYYTVDILCISKHVNLCWKTYIVSNHKITNSLVSKKTCKISAVILNLLNRCNLGPVTLYKYIYIYYFL